MVLLGTVAVSALLTAMLLIAARRAWRSASQPRRRPRAASRRRRAIFRRGPDADAALRRHPAGRSRYTAAVVHGELTGALPVQWPPVGPDDDPEFIEALERLIRGHGGDTYPR
jgi:hypothetical protein